MAFATKPELAWAMIERAVQAGVPFSWVTGDEVYGGNPKLRQRLEERQVPYVMAVACSETVTAPAGSFRADELAALVPAGAWQRLSCADGSKGPRLYDWALIGPRTPGHWLLARRSLRPGEKGELELAFFRCWSPRPVTLAELAAVAGARWGIEVGHRWCRSGCAAFSWVCSLFLVWFALRVCPAGAGVVAGRACPAFT